MNSTHEAGTAWDAPTDIFEDLKAARDLIRSEGDVEPDTLLTDNSMYAYLTFGHLAERIARDLDSALDYRVPRVTLWRHVCECFGWKKPIKRTPPGRHTRLMLNLFRVTKPPELFFFSEMFEGKSVNFNHDEVEIEISRGDKNA
jgi:hypothetical protein